MENKRIAILATHGFEEMELKRPMESMKESGFIVDIVSDEPKSIKGWSNGNWSNAYPVDKTLDQVNATHYDALMLPGGVLNPDTLRMNEDALIFVRDFFKYRKPVAAICHAPWLLISADVVKDRKLTSYKSIKDDLINAGAHWVDQEVVVDKGFVTSRSPKDLSAFCEKLIEEIRKGKHVGQTA